VVDFERIEPLGKVRDFGCAIGALAVLDLAKLAPQFRARVNGASAGRKIAFDLGRHWMRRAWLLHPLPFLEIADRAVVLAVRLKLQHLVGRNQFSQQRGDVHIVVRENPHLQRGDFPFENALVVRFIADADRQQPSGHRH
jgi:hypothetical protein